MCNVLWYNGGWHGVGLTLRAVVATMQWGGGGALLGLWWVDLPHVEVTVGLAMDLGDERINFFGATNPRRSG